MTDSFELFIPGPLPPSLNGAGGLQRSHWAKTRRVKKSWVNRVAAAWLASGRPRIVGPIGIEIVFWLPPGAKFLDPVDNLPARCKLPLDALVKTGAIEDDSRRIVRRNAVYQDRVDRLDQQGISFSVASFTPKP